MRKLKLVVGRAPGALSVLVAAGLVSCGSRSGLPDYASSDASAGSGGSGGIVSGGGTGGIAVGGSGGIALGGFGGLGGTGGTGGSDLCPPFSQINSHEVELPPPGTPAIPGQICAVTTEPVASNTAARVTLFKFSPVLELAQGVITIGPGLEGAIVGMPTVKVSASTSQLQQMQVQNLTPTPGGYTFDASWPIPLDVGPNGYASMVVEVSFEILCDATTGDTRTVSSITIVHLCLTDSQTDVEWVSSGDECTVCEIIAEMAPSPIVPDKLADDLPLAQAIRLRLIALARIGKSLVLFAENDGGDACEYDWHPSSGTLEGLAPDVVLWTPDDDDSFVQAAVSTQNGMAVASYSLREMR